MISKVVQLVREQRARACLLVPDWAREWFPTLIDEAEWWWLLSEFEPCFRRRVKGEWQMVRQKLFKPMVVFLDFTCQNAHP